MQAIADGLRENGRETVLSVAKVGAIVVAAAFGIRIGFHPPTGTIFNGLCTGTLYGLIGVSLILVYRTHRIINFAVAGIGAVPGISAVLLMVTRGWSWYIAFPMAILGGAIAGGLIDVAIMRRFAKAPRLILTVATIGVSQILAYIGFLIGLGLGTEGEQQPQPTTPFSSLGFFIGKQKFTHDYTFAVTVVIVCVVGLGLFLRFSRIGIALRASAENSERASLLGIPVSRVQTVSWVLSGALAGVVLFMLSTIVGVPGDASLGPQVLIYALTAAVIGRMDRIGVTLVAGMGVGVLVESSLVRTGSDSITTGVMLAIILVALVFQRGALSRAMDAGVSTWQAVKEFRGVPYELRDVREVKILKGVVAFVIAAFFLGAPLILDEARIGDAHTVVIACIVAVSLVILTGWAGQISLGQFGLVGVGAIVAGRMAVTWNQDLFLILIASAIAGAIVAVLVGLPALRLPGLYLGVTTLAFAASMHYLFLNRSYWIGRDLLPPSGERIVTPCLWDGRLCLGDGVIPTRGYYYFCLAILGLVVLMARSYRSTRAGRAVLAVRENSRAASSYSVNPARTKLAAFAVSGAIAATGGALIAFQSGSIDASTYGVNPSLRIFVTVVIGGLTSIPGAIFGTVLLESIRLFGEDAVRNLSLLVTGPGLLVVLLILPGGFAEGLYRLRDSVLRSIAKRNGIDVPSLVADRRIETGTDQEHVIEDAEHAAEELTPVPTPVEAAR